MKTMFRCLCVLLAVLCGGYAIAQDRVKSGSHEVLLGKAPSWVKVQTLSPDQLKRAATIQGSHYLLEDEQVDFRGKGQQAYYRRAVRIADQETLRELGEFHTTYSSVFNTLTIHHVDVYRNGQKISKLDAKTLKLIQEEKDWDQRVLQGYVKAFMPIQDLRLGDVLDFSYTIRGDNPILGKKIRWSMYQKTSLFKAQLRHRILIESNRPLTLRTFNNAITPVVASTAGTTEYLVETENVQPFVMEAGTPLWEDQVSFVQFSEFKDWTEVVDWGVKLFEKSGTASQRVAEFARQIVQSTPDPEARISKARQFVQDEIRYLSMSIGSNAYLPYPPEEVLDRRFGDCKDKSGLFVSIVRAMGYEAYPVLVSTSQRHMVASRLPGSQLFDHAIAKVVVGEKSYWVDATMTRQPFTLGVGSVGAFEYGLVLKPGTSELEKIGAKLELSNSTESVFRYKFSKFNQPVTLNATVLARGEFASLALAYQESLQFERFMEGLIGALHRVYAGFKLVNPPALKFDSEKGQVEIKFDAEIQDAFEEETDKLPLFNLYPGYLPDLLRLNANAARKSALMVAPSQTIVHKDILEFDEPTSNQLQPVNDQIGDQYLQFKRELRLVGNRKVELVQKLTLSRDYLAAGEIAAGIQTRNRIREKMVASYRPYPSSYRTFLMGLDSSMRATFPKLDDSNYSKFLSMRYESDAKASEEKLSTFAFDRKSRVSILKEIAIANSLGNRKDLALQRVEEALALDSSRADVISLKGQLLFAKGDFAGAQEMLLKARDSGATDSETARYLGWASLYRQQFNQAVEQFETAFHASSSSHAKWFSLLGMRLAAAGGGIDNADKEKRLISELGEGRPFASSLYDFLAGKISERELQRAGKSDSTLQEWRNRAEMFYFAGRKSLLAGDIAEAAKYFEKVRDLGVVDYLETVLAGLELKRLRP